MNEDNDNQDNNNNNNNNDPNDHFDDDQGDDDDDDDDIDLDEDEEHENELGNDADDAQQVHEFDDRMDEEDEGVLNVQDALLMHAQDAMWRTEQYMDRRNQTIMQDNEIEFAQLCTAIHNNDPTVTEFIDPYKAPRGYVRRLGDALVGNTHVTRIMLLLRHQQLTTNHEDFNMGDERLVSSLLDYLRSGPALRKVEIYGGDRVYIQLVVRALTANARLELLHMEGAQQDTVVPTLMEVPQLIRTTRMLHSLAIPLSRPTDNSDTLLSAIVANRTIQCLRLQLNSDTMGGTIQGRIFSNYVLQSPITSQLSSLSVIEYGQQHVTAQVVPLYTSLSMFLQTAATSLHLLNIVGMTFDIQCMEIFLVGIRHHPSLYELSLGGCVYDNAAALCFVDFWQNSTVVVDSQEQQRTNYNIKSLQIVGDTSRNMMGVSTVTTTMSMGQVLALSLQKSCTLERLCWYTSGLHATAAFWNTLGGERVDEVRVSSIEIKGTDDAAYNAMIQCVPRLQYLRELNTTWHHHDNEYRPFLEMVRQNGSLYEKTHEHYYSSCSSEDGRHTSPMVARVIQAYFYRNAHLPYLLQNSGMLENNECQLLPPVSLFPALFVVAQPATCFAPNNILIGLLSLNATIGPTRSKPNNKRLRDGEPACMH